MIQKEVVLSGIRATGRLHLGNYLGAIRNFVDLSQDPGKQCYFFIANLHTLTTRIDPDEIKHDLAEIVLTYLACGISRESVIFAQSSVPETCELAWLLNCLSPLGDLFRMPHFKEKKDKLAEMGDDQANAGLLTYPVLMAADILGPQANLVPVGNDQKPHLEFARDLARRFNNRFGDLFPVPQELGHSEVRIPGLDGSGKMGKSDKNTIDLFDSSEVVWEKLRVAVTDPQRIRKSDPGDPTVCNIFTLHTHLSSDIEIAYINRNCRNAGIGCVECKQILDTNINHLLDPIRERYQELLDGQPRKIVKQLLSDGGSAARNRIRPTVEQAKEMMGVPLY